MSDDVIAALRAENERLKSREEAFLAYEKGRDEEVAKLRAAKSVREKLTQKRLRQESCRHGDIYSSSVTGPWGTSVNSFCWDCGKSWHSHTDNGTGQTVRKG